MVSLQCARSHDSHGCGLNVNCSSVLLEKRKLDGNSITSLNKRYKESSEHVDVDAFNTDVISRIVHEFYEKKVSNTGQAVAGSDRENVI